MTERVAASRLRRPGVMLPAFAGGGLVVGVLAKLADGPITWLGDLATYLAVWVVAVSMIGAFAGSALQAALRSAVAFVGMCAGYYGFSVFVLHFPVGREILAWVAVSLTIVPAVAALVFFARTRERWWSGPLVGAVASLCLLDDAIARVVIALTEQVPDTFLASVRPGQAIINVLSALVIVGFVPRAWRTRTIALVVALLIGVLGAPLFVELRSLLGV